MFCSIVIGKDRHVVYLDDGEFVDIDEDSQAEADFEVAVEDEKDLAFCKHAIEARTGYSSCLHKIDVPYYLLPGLLKRAASAGIDEQDL